MNLKRIFGALLTLLGIGGLLYAAALFVNTRNNQQDLKMIVIYGILGIVFFGTGITLIKATKDEA